MSAKICLSCKRIKATDGEWEAMLTHGACEEPGCVWGEDRCWSNSPCELSPEDVAEKAEAAKELRHGRSLGIVTHEHLAQTQEATAS